MNEPQQICPFCSRYVPVSDLVLCHTYGPFIDWRCSQCLQRGFRPVKLAYPPQQKSAGDNPHATDLVPKPTV